MGLLAERVKGRVRFVFARDGRLWYETDDRWRFSVPYEDTIDYSDQPLSVTFLAEDKAIFFMRWIRKAMKETLEETGE